MKYTEIDQNRIIISPKTCNLGALHQTDTDIRGIPLKNTPSDKNTPLVCPGSETRGGVLIRQNQISRPQAGKFWDFEVQNHVEIVFFAIEIDALVSRNAKIFRLRRACHQNTSNLVDFRQSRSDQKMLHKNTPPCLSRIWNKGGCS